MMICYVKYTLDNMMKLRTAQGVGTKVRKADILSAIVQWDKIHQEQLAITRLIPIPIPLQVIQIHWTSVLHDPDRLQGRNHPNTLHFMEGLTLSETN